MFKILAKINKLVLPSFSKQGLDLAKAKKWQLVILGTVIMLLREHWINRLKQQKFCSHLISHDR